jgi:hypothetical protein
VFGSVCRFLGVDDTVRPRTLDIKHNAYRKQRFRPLLMQMKRRQLFKRLPRPVWRRLMKFLVSESEYPPMAPEMEAQLRERFAEDDTALARSLGRSLPWRPA